MTAPNAKYSKDTSRASMAKRRIMDSATGLFAERGYGNVGINEVGVTAGFGKGALYYHIRSKEDLLVSIVYDHMDRLTAETKLAAGKCVKTAEKIYAMAAIFVEHLLEYADAMTVSYRDIHAVAAPENIQVVDDLHNNYRQIWTDVFENGARSGEHRPVSDQEIEIFLAMMFSSVFWVGPGSETDPEKLIATFSHNVISAVQAPVG